ncbi:pikachurin-like protein [Leptotrombidium deliense]|uniref:Pikachurin-like protein n=1 Tax=Leptotrombidium deliense TaxID=299467 RepID=A0A443ST36_9ACAR|nr:pikachurin-like protein [Leptotrombidium deliense]
MGNANRKHTHATDRTTTCSANAAMEVRFPRFRGRSYLALPTLRDAHKSMKITIEFKPEYYDGILLYSGEKRNLDGDFIAVVLTQGFVEFR